MAPRRKMRRRRRQGGLKKMVTSIVKKQFKPELKVASIARTTYAVSSTGTVPATLTGVAEGDGQEERVGNSYCLKSLQVKGSLIVNAAASNTAVRLLLIIDKRQVSDTAPTWTGVFESHNLESFKENLYHNRYKILLDRSYTLNATTPRIPINWYKKMNLNVKFNGTASSDYEANHVYLFCISNEATNTPTLAYSSRIRYYDF